ncbi:hypothetical protein QG083_01590 [Kingella kingae]|uniref:PilW family protein n=1 Tax=Kingella kingae TaxID=504 RepID=UPI00254B4D52|nr:hypothetical protein [Kingella kingae]MDK4611883.1 hypothetical protein [Kingella kingae]
MNKRFISKPKGFTLIEFLVASSLAIIVISAAGGTYFMTRKLSDNTQKRLDIQQNLRNAASLLTRDARNAGTFGCFNTAIASGFPNLANARANVGAANPTLVMSSTSNEGYGVRVIPQAEVASKFPVLNAVTAQSDLLLLVYGKGSTGVTQTVDGGNPMSTLNINKADNDADLNQAFASGGNIIVSSCKEAALGTLNGAHNVDTTQLRFNPAINLVDMKDESEQARGELAVSRLYASAYMLGSVNGSQPALLRFDLNGSGQWQGPQLMAEGVTKMQLSFGYVDGCTNQAAVNGSELNKETFSFSNNLSKQMLPALIRLHLKYRTSIDDSNNSETDYFINATVRGGNTCSTVTPSI